MNLTDRHWQLSWLMAMVDIALSGRQSVFAYHRYHLTWRESFAVEEEGNHSAYYPGLTCALHLSEIGFSVLTTIDEGSTCIGRGSYSRLGMLVWDRL
jgi:hypothetical protein